MEFFRQEYWSGLPFPSPGEKEDSGDLPDPGIEPRSPALQADTLLAEPPGRSHERFYGLEGLGLDPAKRPGPAQRAPALEGAGGLCLRSGTVLNPPPSTPQPVCSLR